MKGVVKRWGGSWAIRVDAAEARCFGLQENAEVEFDLRKPKADWSGLPTFKDLPDAGRRHDELLYGRD